MFTFSEELLLEYCKKHNSKASRRLKALIELSYDREKLPTRKDRDYMEDLIDNETNQEYKQAFESLYEDLFEGRN